MNRQQMITIISAMDEDYLMHMLSSVGIEGEGMGGERSWMDDELGGLDSWESRQVAVPPPNKPSLLDTKKFVEHQVNVPRPAYADMGQDMEGIEEFALGAGNMPLGV